jgi:two-component system, OmpR family, phosphate regulon response regulator PhoB
MPRVLLVEDDASLGQTLAERLELDSVDVVWVRTIADGEARTRESNWDLAIIDIRLPDGSGLGLARRIKRSTTIPVMFMTALNSAEHRLEGYEIGADEYLPKPFHLKEFLLRVRHVLSTQRPARVIRSGAITIDLNALAVDVRGHDRTFLQTRDGKVLALLIDAAPRVVDRSEILDGAWGEDRFPTPRAVDNAIVRLRQAIGDTEGTVIRSVRGVGYQWAGEVER